MANLSQSRDRLIESMALPVLNSAVLQPYGKATGLRLDSNAKTLDLILDLQGEKEPVQIQLKNYELIAENDRLYIVIKGIFTSREWLSTLARHHLLNRRFEVPPQAAALFSKFLL